METILINCLVFNTVTYTNTGGLTDLFATACSNPLEVVYPHSVLEPKAVQVFCPTSQEILPPGNEGSQVKPASIWQDKNPGSSVSPKDWIWAPTPYRHKVQC